MAKTKEEEKVIDHASRHHYINGGSSIKRRMLCPGSAEIEKQCPSSSSADADYGTFIHEGIESATEQAFKNGGVVFALSPLYKPDDVLLVEAAVTNVWDIVGDKFDKIAWGVEKKFILDHDLELGGTADFYYAYQDIDGTKIGGIWDYKNGIVETDIIQCILYMTAMQEQAKGSLDILRGHIYQPNSLDENKVVKFIELTKAEIAEYREQFIETARVSLGQRGAGAMKLVPGEEQCRFCSGTAVCPAARQKAKDLIESVIVTQGEALPDPATLPQKLGEESVLKWLKMSSYIKLVDKAMWGYAAERAANNAKIEGTKLVYGRSTTKWDPKKPDEEIAEALRAVGVKEPYNRNIRGVTELTKEITKAKVIKKDEREALLASLRVKNPPSITIVLDDEANSHKQEIQVSNSDMLELIKQNSEEQES